MSQRNSIKSFNRNSVSTHILGVSKPVKDAVIKYFFDINSPRISYDGLCKFVRKCNTNHNIKYIDELVAAAVLRLEDCGIIEKDRNETFALSDLVENCTQSSQTSLQNKTITRKKSSNQHSIGCSSRGLETVYIKKSKPLKRQKSFKNLGNSKRNRSELDNLNKDNTIQRRSNEIRKRKRGEPRKMSYDFMSILPESSLPSLNIEIGEASTGSFVSEPIQNVDNNNSCANNEAKESESNQIANEDIVSIKMDEV